MRYIARAGVALKTQMRRFAIINVSLILGLSAVAGAIHVPTAYAADTIYTADERIDLSGDDEASGPHELPFDFDFYDQTVSEFYVSTNGVIDFENANSSYPGEDLSDSNGTGDYALYPYWNDLDSYDAQTIYTKTIGTVGNRKFIIQYTNHGHHDGTEGMPFSTFQVILSETSNTIQFQYKYLLGGSSGLGGSHTTVGIADGGGLYEQYLFDDPILTPGQGILFTPGGTDDYTVNDNATDPEIYLTYTSQPDAPVLSSPADEAEEVAVAPTLDWAAADGADFYDVFVASRSDFDEDSIAINTRNEDDGEPITDTSYEITSSLRPNRTYYWFVVANSEDGLDRQISEIHQFTTTSGPSVTVSNCEELQAIDDDVENSIADINLSNDIDCSGVENVEPIGYSGEWGDDGVFKGTFDGNYHTISHLNMDYPGTDNIGLFRETDGANIRNLVLSSGTIAGNSSVGALAGEIVDTSVNDIRSNIDVSADDFGTVGGLIGFVSNESSTASVELTSLSSTGDVVGYDDAGGLIGEVENDEGGTVVIQNSFATGNVSTSDVAEDLDTHSEKRNYGGLIGDVEVYAPDNGESLVWIYDTYAKGDVIGEDSVGGLVGDMTNYDNGDDGSGAAQISLQSSYASGNVEAGMRVGGLIGQVEGIYEEEDTFTLESNFAAGTVTATGDEDYAGGLIGENEYNPEAEDPMFNINSSDNYFDSSSINVCSGQGTIDDCTGVSEATHPGYFKSNHTNQPMHSWNFAGTWHTLTGGYPVLRGGTLEFPSAQDGSNIGIISAGCGTINAASVKESSLDLKDVAYDYPAGLVDFTLLGCEPGGVASVSLVFTGDKTDEDMAIRKYNPETNSYTTLTAENSNLEVEAGDWNGNASTMVTYTITDGGDLDLDGEANGTIVDPVGLGINQVGSPNTGL